MSPKPGEDPLRVTHKALGKLGVEGDAPVPAFTLLASTNLPPHSPHTSSVGGKAWGTSRVEGLSAA